MFIINNIILYFINDRNLFDFLDSFVILSYNLYKFMYYNIFNVLYYIIRFFVFTIIGFFNNKFSNNFMYYIYKLKKFYRH